MLGTPGRQMTQPDFIRVGRLDPIAARRPQKRRDPNQSYYRLVQHRS